jgi:hypothetical protein
VLTFNSSGSDIRKWNGRDLSDRSLWVNGNNAKLYHTNFRFGSEAALCTSVAFKTASTRIAELIQCRNRRAPGSPTGQMQKTTSNKNPARWRAAASLRDCDPVVTGLDLVCPQTPCGPSAAKARFTLRSEGVPLAAGGPVQMQKAAYLLQIKRVPHCQV